MSKKIPDFTDSQIWTVDSTLAERFKKKIGVQSIDSENRLHPHDRELTPIQAGHAREMQQESESAS